MFILILIIIGYSARKCDFYECYFFRKVTLLLWNPHSLYFDRKYSFVVAIPRVRRPYFTICPNFTILLDFHEN